MINPFGDCKGCAERQEAIRVASRKMAGWFKQPPSLSGVQLPDHIVEVRALALFLAENPGATENDWKGATEVLRANYRAIVKADS